MKLMGGRPVLRGFDFRFDRALEPDQLGGDSAPVRARRCNASLVPVKQRQRHADADPQKAVPLGADRIDGGLVPEHLFVD